MAPERPTAVSGAYTQSFMALYIGLNQTLLWVCYFLSPGLGVHTSIRTGQVAAEMQKPLPYFPMVVAREAGTLLYHLCFRALPMASVFALTTGYPLPARPLAAAAAVALGAYVGLCLQYLIGLSAFLTHEVRWLHWLYLATFGINGAWLPVDLLPDGLRAAALALPFAAQVYYPASVWLGLRGAAALLPGLFWAAALTLVCLGATARARRHLEVQGG